MISVWKTNPEFSIQLNSSLGKPVQLARRLVSHLFNSSLFKENFRTLKWPDQKSLILQRYCLALITLTISKI